MPGLICPLCPLERTSQLNLNLKNFLKHVQLFHSHQPSFSITCGISGCLRHFKNFRVFRNHVYAFHSGDPNISNEPASNHEDDDNGSVESPVVTSSGSNSSESTATSIEDLQRHTALFLLGLKEKYKLTQAAIEGVIEGVTGLIQYQLSLLHSQVCENLQKNQMSPDCINHLFSDVGPFGRPFSGLETKHQQMKYYATHFDYIEPIRVSLQERFVWKGSGSNRRYVSKKDEVMYIPLLSTLQSIMKSDFLVSEVVNGHGNSLVLADYCDGENYRSHSLFCAHSTAFQIFFYYDDVEVVNPLGSKTKVHKLSIFYFTLGNISPKHRSKLTSIYLVAITKQKNVARYGMDAILSPFIQDVQKLECGYPFILDGGVERVLYGTVCVVSADNLGSLALGGFKESCTATRCCRHCMTNQSDAKSKFTESQFVLRDRFTHTIHCARLETDPDASKAFGVNRNSILNDLRHFHVCGGGLVPDVMHDVLEGALQYEVKLMLDYFVQTEQYFSVDAFNSRLINLELGYMEGKDRPTAISVTNSVLILKQSAAQMWLLGRILPLVIGDYVPDDDERWLNYLMLMDVVDLLFCPQISEDNVVYLAALISDHHENFSKLYPTSSVIPKMHFMVHMPRLILWFGPLVRHWTMRFEAKHAYFKSLAQSMGNFINIAYTLATRHQLYLCHIMETSSNDHLTTGPGCAIPAATLQDDIDCDIQTVFQCRWVIVDGAEYKNEAAVVYSVNKSDGLPKVAKIISIYLINSSTVVFKSDCFSTQYDPHYRAYILDPLHVTKYIYHSTLPLHLPLHIRSSSALSVKNVIMPYCISN